MCQTPLPAGCDCDPRDPNPDSYCSSGQVCQVSEYYQPNSILNFIFK